MAPRLLSQAVSATAQTTKAVGDISSVFPSLSGKKPESLHEGFSYLKKRLVRGHQGVVEASWLRLLARLRQEIKIVKSKGSDVRSR